MMEVTSAAPTLAIQNLTFGEGVLYAILGMLVVFFALVLIMVIIKILVKVTDSSAAKKAAKAAEAPAEAAPAEPAAPVKRDDPAPGTAGDIKLYTTDPKDAAMIMAIVADALGKPLNELRFKSIRDIKE